MIRLYIKKISYKIREQDKNAKKEKNPKQFVKGEKKRTQLGTK